MQLHACLLLFIITTDKTLVLSLSDCGGEVSVDQEPVGHISLMLPGLFTDTNTLNPVNHHSDKSISNCTWMINIPLGKSVTLKGAELDSSSRLSVHCVWNKEDHGQVLERGGTALLSGCDGNKAALTWTRVGHSLNVIQLSYHVQDDERNSLLDHTSPYSAQDYMHSTQMDTSFTSTDPVSQELVRRTERMRGHLHEGLESSPRLQSVSGSSSLEQDLLHPTSPLQQLSVAGRGTLPFPEEGPNNGADTSGVAHRTDSPLSATHPYFRHTLHTDSSNTANTETSSSNELPQTQTALTDATANTSHIFIGTGTHNSAVKRTTSQSYHTLSTSIALPLTSSPPDLPPPTTLGSGRVGVLILHSGTSGENQPHSWKNQRSTHETISDLTSAFTTDPSESPSDPWQDYAGSVHGDRSTPASFTSSQSHSMTEWSSMTERSSTTSITESDTTVNSFHPIISGTGSVKSVAPDVSSPTAVFQPSDHDDKVKLHTPTASTQSQTNLLQSTESLTHSPHASSTVTQTQTTTERTQGRFTDRFLTTDTIPSSPSVTTVEGSTSTLTGSTPSPTEAQNSVVTETTTETYTLHPTSTLPHEFAPSNSPIHPLPSSTFLQQSATSHPHSTSSSLTNHTPISLSSVTSVTKSTTIPTVLANHKTEPTSSQTTIKPTSLLTPLLFSATNKRSHEYITITHSSLLSITTEKSDYDGTDAGGESWRPFPSITTTHTTTAGSSQRLPPWTASFPGQGSSAVPTTSISTTSKTPQFYIMPDQPAALRVESIELLLQIIVEESRSAFTSGLEEDTTAWVEPYLQKAPGFSRLLGVWSSGHAVQSLVEFKASDALHWLSVTGPGSLLERTGLAQAVRDRKSFRSSRITNITLGGLQGDVCDWLLQCPEGYRCVSQPETATYNCSSACHFDYCHHHGICTHHPGQIPVCRCLVGDDFWYMGQRCDMRMTRARLVGACLAILLIMVTVIGVLAFIIVRRYRAILIQAKVDQTRSSYRRFNHFDELSGRFWLRSWAGSADSMDNPAFTRSDELLHLRALDRTCCYHDDTLSLASTCPSNGTHVNTIYPHSSQYGWRGSGVSMGDGVLDSGKASDLSVCSWPVEPIHWTPFPLLQQLASRGTPTVRVSRPRSYCEGMELVEMGKSWTA